LWPTDIYEGGISGEEDDMKVFFAVAFVALLMFPAGPVVWGQQGQSDGVNTPIWHPEDRDKYSFPFYRTQVILNGHRPPFYEDSLPVKYIAYTKEISACNLRVYCDFDGFRNEFIFWGPRFQAATKAEGIRTTDFDENLLAEARISRIIRNEDQKILRIEIKEYHYDSQGKVKFRCRSQFDPSTGFKVQETEINGEKDREYYFLWPSNNFCD
jgi:hypothetical protein